jgi:hypothetical protein
MPELLRTLVSRIREFAGDRRHMARHRLRLEFSVAPEGSKANGRRPQSLKGYTRDVSAKGLGLIVPAIRIGERYLAGENCRLTVTLELPSGPIEVRAIAMRYEPLEDEIDQGYLIGARITEMSEEHLKLFKAFLAGDLKSVTPTQ